MTSESACVPHSSCIYEKQLSVCVHHRPTRTTDLLELDGDTEEDNAPQTLLDQRSQEPFELVNSPSLLSWQRLDLDLGIGIVRDEDGVHEHVFAQGPASGLVSPQEGVVVTSCED